MIWIVLLCLASCPVFATIPSLSNGNKRYTTSLTRLLRHTKFLQLIMTLSQKIFTPATRSQRQKNFLTFVRETLSIKLRGKENRQQKVPPQFSRTGRGIANITRALSVASLTQSIE